MDIQALRDKVSSVYIGDVVASLDLNYNSTALTVNFPQFSPNLAEDTFDNTLINRNILVDHNLFGYDKGSKIDVKQTVARIHQQVVDGLLPMLTSVLENKAPRQTKIFQDMRKLRKKLARESVESKIFSDIYDVSDYYFSVTKEKDIRSSDNAVHRKNVLALLKRIVEVYGKQNDN